MVSTPFKIAIIGGGISGLTTALFLHHFCGHHEIKIDVYEQADEYRDIGSGVTIGVNAAKLLHIIGIGEAVNAIAGSRDGVWFTIRRFDNSQEITTIYSNDNGKIRQAAVSRAGLLKLLLGFIKKRKAAKLHTRKKFLSAKDLGHHTRIEFADSTSTTAHLVLGCDGIHSAIRRHFVHDKAVYTGKILYRGIIPMSEIAPIWTLPSFSAMWIGRGKHLVMYSIDGNKTLNFVGCVTEEEDKLGNLKESWSTTCDKRELQDQYSDGNEFVRKVLALAPERPSKWVINDREPIPEWTFQRGKVVLVGDAAHPMVPHQSAGAGQGIEDGYIISKVLAEHLNRSSTGKGQVGDLEKWMHLYQRVRLPRASKVQETSRDTGRLYHLTSPAMNGKTYEECLAILTETVKKRVQWIWTEDLDVLYDQEKDQMFGGELEETQSP
ncbi:salicylate hydroxylase [Cladorrhinum sp. PSN332]|nr:salicylate hydroxylase [Cladorrhinum sp. PSN332]